MPILALTAVCVFIFSSVNVFAEKPPSPVQGTCELCKPPSEGWFSFGYDKDGNKITVFVSSEPGGGSKINGGWAHSL